MWAWVLLQGRPTTVVGGSWDGQPSQTPDELVPDAIRLVAWMPISSLSFHFVQVANALPPSDRGTTIQRHL